MSGAKAAGVKIFSSPKAKGSRVLILSTRAGVFHHPGLLAQCDNASKLSKDLVADWLTKYMFRGLTDGGAKAAIVADHLSDHPFFLSHGRRVKLEHLRAKDVAVSNLRDDPVFYEAVWALYCMIDIMLTNTPAYKIFYNSANVAMIRHSVQGGMLNMPMPRHV
jgi:hypothetical protein